MQKYNVLTVSIITILFALLFTPLLVDSETYFPYLVGKVFMFRLGVALSFVLWLILIIRSSEYLPKKSSIIAASGIFVVWLAISNTFGADPEISFFSSYERMEGWFTHLYLFMYLLVMTSIVRTQKLWNWILGTSVAVALIMAIYAAFTEGRPNVFLGNSTYVALFMFFNAFFAAYLAWNIHKNVKRVVPYYGGIIFYIFSILLFVFVIFKTQTRGTVLALIASIGLFLIFTLISHWKVQKVKIAGIVCMALIVLGVGIFWSARDSQFVKSRPMLDRLTTISISEGTGRARIINWQIALEGIKERPLLGWGQENYLYVFSKYYDPRLHSDEPWFDRTHNIALDWAVQAGIIGLVLYVLILAGAAAGIFKSPSFDSFEKNLFYALIVGYIVHNLFVFDSYSSYFLFFTFLGFVIFRSGVGNSWGHVSDKKRIISALILIGIILLLFVMTMARPYLANKKMFATLWTVTEQEAVVSYQKTLEVGMFETEEIVIRMLNDQLRFMQSKDPVLRQEYLDVAVKSAETLINKKPYNVRNIEALGGFYLTINRPDLAVPYFERALALTPNRQRTMHALGFAYLFSGQVDKAEEMMKRAYDIDPAYKKAKSYYGLVLLVKKDSRAWEYLAGYDYWDPLIISVLTSLKMNDEIVQAHQKRFVEYPDNYKVQLDLAIALVDAGKKQEGIEMIRKVIEDVPGFTEQGTQLIKDIEARK